MKSTYMFFEHWYSNAFPPRNKTAWLIWRNSWVLLLRHSLWSHIVILRLIWLITGLNQHMVNNGRCWAFAVRFWLTQQILNNLARIARFILHVKWRWMQPDIVFIFTVEILLIVITIVLRVAIQNNLRIILQLFHYRSSYFCLFADWLAW